MRRNCMSDLVSEHLGEFLVGRLEGFPHAAVDRDFAARHGEGIHRLGFVDDLHLPGPFRSLGTQPRGLGDQPVGDGAYARGARRAAFDLLLLLELAHHLAVRDRRALDRLLFGHDDEFLAPGHRVLGARSENEQRSEAGDKRSHTEPSAAAMRRGMTEV